MTTIDTTIVNVALPSIQEDLAASPSALAWMLNSYLVAFGGVLLLAGRYGDLWGRGRMFIAGLTAFTAASFACGISGSPGMLITARFAQGIGAAMTSSVMLGLIVATFPEPRERSRAISIFGGVAGAGASIGLVFGGLLTQAISWHWIFIVNLPIGLAVIVAARRFVPLDRGMGLAHGADIAGATFATASLMLGVYAIVDTERSGWLSRRTLVLGATSVALLAIFLVRQVRGRAPLLPLQLFRSRQLTVGNIVTFGGHAAMYGYLFLNTLYLQRVYGYDPLRAGLAILPTMLSVMLSAVLLGVPLIARFGARTVILVGLVLDAVGLLFLARLPTESHYLVHMFPVAVLVGIGNGLWAPASMGLAMATATGANAGVASGIVNTMRLIGAAVGVAVMATLATSRADVLRESGRSAFDALAGSYRFGFAISAATFAGFVVLTAVVPLRARSRSTVLAPRGGPARE